MKLGDFTTGTEFVTETGRWRCTDVGTRVIIAIKISDVSVVTSCKDGDTLNQDISPDFSWTNGPPYAVTEIVFDENDLAACWT